MHAALMGATVQVGRSEKVAPGMPCEERGCRCGRPRVSWNAPRRAAQVVAVYVTGRSAAPCLCQAFGRGR